MVYYDSFEKHVNLEYVQVLLSRTFSVVHMILTLRALWKMEQELKEEGEFLYNRRIAHDRFTHWVIIIHFGRFTAYDSEMKQCFGFRVSPFNSPLSWDILPLFYENRCTKFQKASLTLSSHHFTALVIPRWGPGSRVVGMRHNRGNLRSAGLQQPLQTGDSFHQLGLQILLPLHSNWNILLFEEFVPP